MQNNDTKYLRKKNNKWLFRIKVPKDLQAFFFNKKVFYKSTKADINDIEKARKVRDVLLYEFKLMVIQYRKENLKREYNNKFTKNIYTSDFKVNNYQTLNMKHNKEKEQKNKKSNIKESLETYLGIKRKNIKHKVKSDKLYKPTFIFKNK